MASWLQSVPAPAWGAVGSLASAWLGRRSSRRAAAQQDTNSWEQRKWLEGRYDIERTHGREDALWDMEQAQRFTGWDRRNANNYALDLSKKNRRNAFGWEKRSRRDASRVQLRHANLDRQSQHNWRRKDREQMLGFNDRQSAQNFGWEEKTRGREMHYDQAIKDADIGRWQGMGLTPQEIAGAPAPGGNVSGGSSQTLGSAASQQASQTAQAHASQQMQSQQSAQRFQTNQNYQNNMASQEIARIQANSQMRVASTQAEAQMMSAMIKAGMDLTGTLTRSEDKDKDRRQQNLHFLSELQRKANVDQGTINKIQEETKSIINTREQDQAKFRERWTRRFSEMGPDNVITSLIAAYNGVDLKELLTGDYTKLTPKKRELYKKTLQDAASQTSTLYKSIRALLEESDPDGGATAGELIKKTGATIGEQIQEQPFLGNFLRMLMR